ncbi:1-acyl-sn-glycerol-3-phosphate acyltransferase [Marinoscillum sp. MHG1-6]|uniref:1-acyl-sn-glycerol-3-phosphate acyltransferase n=1 Tax=Marinoscillum sp. MHG1-6 TaxID=2959627 RepID=UPI0021587712|nr:1-acyl-sn-glycerol-3-phosphate acyltransferase [Marinoscillum sp. MHG1-6]
MKYFFRFCFWLTGWKIIGHKPTLNKYVLIVAPHTSNWDFFVGLAARTIEGIHSRFLIKDSITKLPVIGQLIEWLGGRGVDRSKSTRVVDQIAEMYSKEQEFVMTITPEGTRSYSPNWKTGFYRLAVMVNIPIQMVGFDYGKKEVVFRELFYPTGDADRDIEYMKAYYRTIRGKHPEKGVK